MKFLITSVINASLIICSICANGQSYIKLHTKALVVDTHNDVMISMLEGKDIATDLKGQTHSDLLRFKQGGVDAQFFSIWCDETYGNGTAFKFANRQIDTLLAN